MNVFRVLLLLGLTGLSLLLSGCDRSFRLEHVAKSDIDMVFDAQVRATNDLLRQLMLKLYLRNPAYWRHTGAESAEQRVEQLFNAADTQLMQQLQDRRSIDSIRLAFDENFSGDRVLAFVFGLKSMLADAYGGKQSFYLLDTLDPQKLYNAARNIEVAVWKLSNDRDLQGEMMLVSNELQGEVINLSFERLFGKLIAIQDSSARIVADSSRRTIKNVIQGVASYVFLPI